MPDPDEDRRMREHRGDWVREDLEQRLEAERLAREFYEFVNNFLGLLIVAGVALVLLVGWFW